ncbi:MULTISPECIES: M23 family metallopeptidase [unclassified Anaerotruncus]|jgi:murein DD-endopeptidase MepM/ murein hydrolase activator NlpD|uniref:murein hydrolase activator EnvC family protein n=1 Tax=unclassified Anaerotruncus TaxID=2641626 RepID=UPI00033FC2BB|nr:MULTISPECIES: M23 family metallopeptidase [unclassified Anaerotruncus]EOS56771.1 hypothetical protein C814_02642 [Anaerotruncus sp. G3(2012)]MCI9235793.1 peptidoglycan DD-metalloendopeptidase family protein [Anaerotruncus sp.]NBK18851.1 hypothetical protein [Anaerotruncus sp. 1XD42-93]RKJ82062.1 hypothetical protein D7Y41_24675 [Anaerotruncus sp. 1XD22-93]
MSKCRRLLAALLALMLVLPLSVHADEGEELDNSAAQDRLAELNDSYKELEDQKKKVDSQINSARTERKKQEIISAEIDGQINTTTKQIELLNERIGLLTQQIGQLNGSIAQKQIEMEAKEEEISEAMELFKKRMRAIYMSGGGNNTAIGMMLGAESYSQMVIRAEVVGRVAKHDRELLSKLDQDLKELNELKNGIEQDKQEIEQNKSAVEGDKTEMAVKKEELDSQYQMARDKVEDIAAQEQEYLANKAEIQKKLNMLEAEMKAIYDEINKESVNVPYTGGTMRWPSPSLSQITTHFGEGGHTGIDITGGGAYGTPVLASGDGVVKVASVQNPDSGYGKYIIIDHGGGIQTLYAHCSLLSVSVGQTVSAGQQIAQVGSTGWSTGPHIHFEVRKNSQAVNPLAYVGG